MAKYDVYLRNALALSLGFISFFLPIFMFSHASVKLNQTDQLHSSEKSPRILCYINTIPGTYFTKALHVNRTWARRCDKVLFFSSKAEPTLPVIDLHLNYQESRMHLWSKIRKVLRLVYNYRDDFDYFLKADDDTYVFIDNLRRELIKYDQNEPFMMGHLFVPANGPTYLSGGASYVLSKAALKVIVEMAIDKHKACPTIDEDKEDVKMTICGRAVGVKIYQSLDYKNRSRFGWRDPLKIFKIWGWIPPSLKNKMHHLRTNKKGSLPFTFHHISFHYVNPNMMYFNDFVGYNVKVYSSHPTEIY